MGTKFSVENLLSQLMQQANHNYKEKQKLCGSGFVLGNSPVPASVGGTDGRALSVIHASRPVESLEDLRRFSTTVTALVQTLEATLAAVVVELPVAVVDHSEQAAAPIPSVIIYLDQKYGGLHVWVAPKEGEDLVFRDLGNAHPSTNFLPNLIPAEVYGPMADA